MIINSKRIIGHYEGDGLVNRLEIRMRVLEGVWLSAYEEADSI